MYMTVHSIPECETLPIPSVNSQIIQHAVYMLPRKKYWSGTNFYYCVNGIVVPVSNPSVLWITIGSKINFLGAINLVSME